jgi:DNA-directed RNA polymerase subunit K/omega
MRIITPVEAAKQAGNKYLGVLVAAKFARHLNELPKERITDRSQKLTTMAIDHLVNGDLTYKLLRRRRTEA